MAGRIGADVIRLAIGGDPGARAEVVAVARELGYAVARARGTWEQDAEDVAQDVAVAVWRKLPTLTDPARFGGWVETIAERVRANLLRSALFPVELVAGAVPVEPAYLETGAEPGIAVLGLPPLQRRAVLLHYFRGRTVAETAADMGITVNAARCHLKRARVTLARDVDAGRPLTAGEPDAAPAGFLFPMGGAA